MKTQDNNFKRALLKELTGFSYKDKEENTAAPVVAQDEEDDFDFVPATPASISSATANAYASEPTATPAANLNYSPNPTRPATETMATTTVSKATVINGGIQTRENIVVEGVVNGDIISKGKVAIKGKVEGNITGYDIDLTCEELSGDVNCESKAVIHGATKLKGNLYTGRATIIGTVEGNIVAKESIELLDNAVVYGDIKAAGISVSEGAVIYGMVTIGKAKPENITF